MITHVYLFSLLSERSRRKWASFYDSSDIMETHVVFNKVYNVLMWYWGTAVVTMRFEFYAIFSVSFILLHEGRPQEHGGTPAPAPGPGPVPTPHPPKQPFKFTCDPVSYMYSPVSYLTNEACAYFDSACIFLCITRYMPHVVGLWLSIWTPRLCCNFGADQMFCHAATHFTNFQTPSNPVYFF